MMITMVMKTVTKTMVIMLKVKKKPVKKPKPTPKKKAEKKTEKETSPIITKSSTILPDFSDEDILKILGRGNVLKGQEIYDKGYISAFKYGDDGVTCMCKSSSGSSYNLELTFKKDFKVKSVDDTNTLYEGTCSCPVGSEGKCKHMVALLYTVLESEGKSEKETSRFARSKEDEEKIQSKIAEISSNSMATLKEWLKMNDQSASGNKSELLEKVADGMVFGGLPRCPKCAGGRLKTLGNMFVCPGFMEDDTFQECDFTSNDIIRSPWKESK